MAPIDCSTYQGNESHEVHGGSTIVVEIEVLRKSSIPNIVKEVSDGVNDGPDHNCHTEPAVKRQDLRVSEAERVQHGSSENKEQDEGTTSDRTVAGNLSEGRCELQDTKE